MKAYIILGKNRKCIQNIYLVTLQASQSTHLNLSGTIASPSHLLVVVVVESQGPQVVGAVQPEAGVALLQPAQLPAASVLNFPPRCAVSIRDDDGLVDRLCHGVGRGGGGVDVVGVLLGVGWEEDVTGKVFLGRHTLTCIFI